MYHSKQKKATHGAKMKKALGGMAMKKMQMMREGGKLKMVKGPDGKMVPFFAADGKGKMAMGGRMGSKAMMESMKKDDKMLGHGGKMKKMGHGGGVKKARGGVMIVMPVKPVKKSKKKAAMGAKMKNMKARYGAKM
jgi:hypothetical protein